MDLFPMLSTETRCAGCTVLNEPCFVNCPYRNVFPFDKKGVDDFILIHDWMNIRHVRITLLRLFDQTEQQKVYVESLLDSIRNIENTFFKPEGDHAEKIATAAAASGGAAAPPPQEKKEEPKEESDDDDDGF
ncbi:hypothetical protein M8C21_004960, partial [Ambrosia artemisiifolia]